MTDQHEPATLKAVLSEVLGLWGHITVTPDEEDRLRALFQLPARPRAPASNVVDFKPRAIPAPQTEGNPAA